MIPYNTDKNETTEKLFFENEVKTNRFLSTALLILGCALVLSCIISYTSLFDFGGNWITSIILFFYSLNIVTFFIVKLQKYNKPWHKNIIILSTLISSGLIFSMYPHQATFIYYGPTIMSAMYYHPKIIRRTAFISWIIFTIGIWSNVYLEFHSETVKYYHYWLGVTTWKHPKDVFLYRYITCTFMFYIMALICHGIAKRGRFLMLKQSEITAEVISLESDLKTAADIQIETLPAQKYSTDNGNISINAFMRPAKTVGGDFYDYFTFGQNLFFVIADVSDKGMPAAIFMMKAKYTLRSAIMNGDSIEVAFKNANLELCRDNNENMFVTLWGGYVNIQTGIGKYINCGHSFPFVRHADGSTSQIENVPCTMLGFLPNASFSSHILNLQKDDILFLYTDGLTDAENSHGEFFGENRLRQTIQSLPTNLEDSCLPIINTIDGFSTNQDQFDDMTILTIRMNSKTDFSVSECYLEASYSSSSELIGLVNQQLGEKHCPEEIRRNIDVALDEVITNISDYAYPDGNGSFKVISTCGDNFLDIVFCDKGTAFNPLEYKDSRNQSELQIGGLGISLIKNIMDNVEYSRQDNENRLHLIKLWM